MLGLNYFLKGEQTFKTILSQKNDDSKLDFGKLIEIVFPTLSYNTFIKSKIPSETFKITWADIRN